MPHPLYFVYALFFAGMVSAGAWVSEHLLPDKVPSTAGAVERQRILQRTTRYHRRFVLSTWIICTMVGLAIAMA